MSTLALQPKRLLQVQGFGYASPAMGKKSDRQIVAGVETTGSADEVVEAINRRTGIPKRRIVEVVFSWLGRSHPAAQNAVLGLVPEGMEEDYAKLFDELARELRSRKGRTKDVPPTKIVRQ